jgi:glycosyltransferase involved in cell wall biosynthesis
VLVGSGGLDIHACEGELRELARQRGIERQVVFTGAVANVPEYLQAADVFALPTENDAFPSALIEAMACGLAVVATPVGAIPQVIRHGENGLLIPPRDGAALRAALERLLADDALAARLARAALESARADYSAEQVTQCYAELFARLIAEPSARRVEGS